MSFYTLMIVSYMALGAEARFPILYSSQEKCAQAMWEIEAVMDPRFEVTMIECKKTEFISASVRPRARPWKDGEK